MIKKVCICIYSILVSGCSIDPQVPVVWDLRCQPSQYCIYTDQPYQYIDYSRSRSQDPAVR